MRDRIKAVAEDNNRSMNAEIVAALEEKYPAPVIDDAAMWLGYYSEMTANLAEIQDSMEKMGDTSGQQLDAITKRQLYLLDRNRELLDLMRRT